MAIEKQNNSIYIFFQQRKQNTKIWPLRNKTTVYIYFFHQQIIYEKKFPKN